MKKKLKTLPARPKLRICYQAIPMSDNRVQLRSGSDAFIMQGEGVQEIVRDLFPLLTGENLLEDIFQTLNTYDPELLLDFLQKLSARRVIEAKDIEPACAIKKEELDHYAPQLTYFSHFSPNPYNSQAKLQNACVAIYGIGLLGGRLATSLAHAGVGKLVGLDDKIVNELDIEQGTLFAPDTLGTQRSTAFTSSQNPNLARTKLKGIKIAGEGTQELITHLKAVDYLVVCQETFCPIELEWINQACLELSLTWTWCSLDGHTGTIGPTIIPRELPCWKCYDLRVKSNVDHYEEFQAYDNYLRETKSAAAQFGYLLPTLDLLAGLAALEVIKDLSALTPPLTYGAQISIDMLTSEFDLHPLLKLPRCPACGRFNDMGAIVRPFLENL